MNRIVFSVIALKNHVDGSHEVDGTIYLVIEEHTILRKPVGAMWYALRH